jgi:[ribosomal protein S18]-alanine N-acetyltransferase
VRCIADSAHRPETFASIPIGPTATLRGFQTRDIPFVAEIVGEALNEHYDTSLYVSLSQPWPDGFLVAADALGRPVGFLLGVTQIEGEGRILMFAVERGHRRSGVGTSLMDAFLVRARERALGRATLEVRVSNATAIRFYARYGFSVVDLLRGYYSDGENGYQMARALGTLPKK